MLFATCGVLGITHSCLTIVQELLTQLLNYCIGPLVGMCGGVTADPLRLDTAVIQKRATPYHAFLSFFGEDEDEDYEDDTKVKPTTKPRKGVPSKKCSYYTDIKEKLQNYGDHVRQVLTALDKSFCIQKPGKVDKKDTTSLRPTPRPHVIIVFDTCERYYRLVDRVNKVYTIVVDVYETLEKWCIADN